MTSSSNVNSLSISPLTAELSWRKSSRSTYQGTCVEVAASPKFVHMRDSKDIDGPQLNFSHGSWLNFISSVKADEIATHS